MKMFGGQKIEKFISILLIFTFLLLFGFLAFPQLTLAKVPVEDAELIELNKSINKYVEDTDKSVRATEKLTGEIRGDTQSINTYTGKTSGNTGSLVRKEYILDPAFDKIAKTMITMLTAMTVQWIQTGGSYPGGGNGSLFVGDIGGYLLSVADNAAGKYLEQILDPEIFNLLCSPFRTPLYNAVRNFALPTFPRARCTLSDIANNIQNFLNGNFLTAGYGGYQAWNQLILPQNNFYGAYILSTEELLQKQLVRTNTAQSELSFGQGFLSSKTKEMVDTGKKQCVEFGAPYSAPNYTAQGNCLKWAPIYEEKEKISTPGKIIEDQLATQFGSSVRSLEVADELNEIIAAIIQRLITEILMGGGGVANWNSGASPAWQDIQNITQNYKPDLTIGDVSYSPPSPRIGDAITFSGQLINEGTADTSAGFNARLKLDINNDGVFEKENTIVVAPLAMGGNQIITWPNFWNAETGTHKFEICADAQNSVEELNESNNCNSLIFIVPAQPPSPPSTNPDLVVDSISFTPSPTGTGSQMTFNARIRNAGILSAPASAARLRIDVNNDGGWDIDTSVNVPTISREEPKDANWPNVWTATLGVHKAEVCADSTNAINEADEQNNCQIITFEVIKMADLIINSIEVSPLNPNINDQITFRGKVKNQGDQTAGNSATRARIDLQSDGDWDIVLSPDQTTGQLAPGAEETEIWTLKIGLAGQHKIEICTDIGNSVAESRENNNCSSASFYVSYW